MEHGGDLTLAIERFGGTRETWLDLSTGINPHSYPIPQKLAADSWQALPSQVAEEHLISAARNTYQVPDHLELVAAAGTQILLSLLPLILPEGPVALSSPTYSSHKDVWCRENRNPVELSSIYALPADAKIVLLVNPNNPDGQLIDVKSLLEIARTLTDRGGYLVVDEAFADVVPGSSLLPHIGNENILVLRSFGKFFGLAGLRLGFLAGPRNITSRISGLLESWSISGPAMEIGTAALRDQDWQTQTTRRLIEEMADLTVLLSEQELSVFGGTPLYALAGLRNAKALHEALARSHIWTRIFDYAPTWIRFGLPGGGENLKRLEEALADAKKEL
ncbi:MAG: threonine-phosphate decarboxylase CobD [Roseibium sp.]|uniref:threonine-phosphate decarboxylase CobD n=1 Tax=Roseibium sp. TaxID=1936156 RepID=UPI00261EEEB4|nr:threonine-phosphate decarboxylase CobD [Roseibium sp.]MCV0426465.1 threonine-phosphate decarboxylase CobD [Roseibium sp.]